MPLILGTNSIKDTGYDVANSLRFDDGSSDDLQRTFGTSTNTDIFTISIWVKRSTLGIDNFFVYSTGGNSDDNWFQVGWNSTDKFVISAYNTVWLRTNRLFRDVSAWYHIVIKADSSQGTASNRLKLYVNGVEETSFSDDNRGSISSSQTWGWNKTGNTGYVGSKAGNNYYDGYMAEVVMIDGTALDPTSFGEFDEDSGIWKPIDVSGLTFGTNGFYLDFEDSSSLGNDAAGSNNFTVNNLTAIDQTTDTCTNNFATLNSLDNYYAASTFSEGNCKIVTTSGNITYNTSTIGFSSGKWYIENKVGTSSGSVIGPITGVSTGNNNDNKIGNRSDGWGYDYRGLVEHIGADVGGSFATYGAGDIIGVYIDLDNNELYFAKNGTLQNSGTGLALTAGLTYFFATGDNNNGVAITHEVNFGNPTYSISSGNTDPNGYGNFEYDPSAGTFDGSSKSFYALNTKNLAEFG